MTESLQLTTDGDEASANYGDALRRRGDILYYGNALARASDALQRDVEEFTDNQVASEDLTQAITNLLDVAKVVFDVRAEGEQGRYTCTYIYNSGFHTCDY